jgi:hypothetical protein
MDSIQENADVMNPSNSSCSCENKQPHKVKPDTKALRQKVNTRLLLKRCMSLVKSNHSFITSAVLFFCSLPSAIGQLRGSSADDDHVPGSAARKGAVIFQPKS